MDDEDYMKMALELAKKGEGFVSPNPMVGAVIVKDGEIIAEGWHEKYGDLHAERNALKHCTTSFTFLIYSVNVRINLIYKFLNEILCRS